MAESVEKAAEATSISAQDVFTRMIELNFPPELAFRFRNEMKDGLVSYISGDEIPIVKSQDVFSIMALVKLLASFMPNHTGFQDRTNKLASSLNSMMMTLMMCEPWPCFASEVAVQAGLNPSEKEEEEGVSMRKEQSIVSKVKKEPLRNLSNTLTTSSSSSSVVYNRDSTQSSELKCQQAAGRLMDAADKGPTSFESSNVRMLICEQLVTLPKFSDQVEAALNSEEECFKALPNACMELAYFFAYSNLDIRKSSEYRMIAQTILNRYEVLDGIVNRYILNGWLNNVANPPKTSQAHVCKSLQNAIKKIRNLRKREEQKERVNAIFTKQTETLF